MRLNSFQKKNKRVIPPQDNPDLAHLALGLTAKTGEAAAKIDRLLQDKVSHDRIYKSAIAHALGGVLSHIAAIADDIDYPLNKVAKISLKKT